jgi:hypothetical protein
MSKKKKILAAVIGIVGMLALASLLSRSGSSPGPAAPSPVTNVVRVPDDFSHRSVPQEEYVPQQMEIFYLPGSDDGENGDDEDYQPIIEGVMTPVPETRLETMRKREGAHRPFGPK